MALATGEAKLLISEDRTGYGRPSNYNKVHSFRATWVTGLEGRCHPMLVIAIGSESDAEDDWDWEYIVVQCFSEMGAWRTALLEFDRWTAVLMDKRQVDPTDDSPF